MWCRVGRNPVNVSAAIGGPAHATVARRVLGPAVIAAAGLVTLVWSWGTWPDVLIDFGRELYLPWQITRGRALYRDLAHINGPLSPYVNAAWFSLLGVSLRSLVIGNIVIATGIAILLYRLL